MKNFKNISMTMALLAALLLAGCGEVDAPSDPTGSVNPPGIGDASSRYVAIGNSLTAGWMDNGLMQVGQSGSYPRLIANQLGLSSTDFTIPWIAAPGISGVSSVDPSLVNGLLYFNGAGLSSLGSTPLADVQSTLLLAVSQPTAYHNLGVPGAYLTHGMNAHDAASGDGNPFFNFINRSSFFGNSPVTLAAGPPPIVTQSGSMHYKAIAKGAALATVWLGNNDILGAATGGNPVPGDFDAMQFTDDYAAMLSTLAGGLAKATGFTPTVVTANIPGVTSAAFFLQEPTFVQAVGGVWPYGYVEADVQIVLFTALSWITDPANDGEPLPTHLTLTGQEVADVDAATTAFNQAIAGITANINTSGIAKCGMVDANGALEGLAPAQRTHFLLLLGQGIDLTTAAATTYFGLDGVHPNSLGYGFTANLFIDMINSLDGTNHANVDLASITWDPTYGQTLAVTKAGNNNLFSMSPEMAASMTRIFR
ncbi:MAG: hypothetical protein ACI9UK_001264 [Candidatus Krumholzibacteriia bacterium]|jgi:hypothetical protein